MRRMPRKFAIAIIAVVAAVAACLFFSPNGLFNLEVWEREKPLVNPVAVTSVREGVITLANGRTIRPAGVRRREGVSVDAYDNAIRVMAAQGVEIDRDLGDGTAFLKAKPKSYNWCGTRGYKGNPFARWAGSYFQCSLSELLIRSGCAASDLDNNGLTDRERWRLVGIEQIGRQRKSELRISKDSGAICYDVFLCDECSGRDLQILWRPMQSP